MSSQTNLLTLPSAGPLKTGHIANQRIFENQRRFSAMTRGLTPGQIDKIFQNIQLFITAECDVAPSTTNRISHLSKREQEVLVLVSNGYSRREIGDSLGITANTAARHITNIYNKLGVTSVAEATRYALALSAARSAE